MASVSRSLITCALGPAAALALAAAMAVWVAPAAQAKVTCPTVNSTTGAVTPAPAPTANVDWSGCNLSGADLKGLTMIGANLSAANLSHAFLDDSVLTSSDIEGANLDGASLTDTWLGGANLADSTLTSANLDGTTLVGADLSGAQLSEADALTTDFDSATLTDTDFGNATLADDSWIQASMTGTVLGGTEFATPDGSGGITGTPASLPENWTLLGGYLIGPEDNLDGANLSGLDLGFADLEGSNLTAANLAGTNLTNANLDEVQSGFIEGTPSLPTFWEAVAGYLIGPTADLSGDDLVDVDLSNAYLTSADLTSAELIGVNLTDASMTAANLDGATLERAVLSGTDLTQASLVAVAGDAITASPLPSLPAGWQLVGGYLVGPQADLAGADFDLDTGLASADLAGANLTEASLDGVDLSAADLDAATLTDANLAGTDLSGADLEQVVSGGIIASQAPTLPPDWSLVSGYLSGPTAYLEDAELSGADLAGVDLAQANLEYAALDGANLDSANFTDADLTQADLDDATNYATATWTGVTWDYTTCPNGKDSEDYVDGCFSAPDTTPPSAAPELEGTLGSNGWYVTPVTVVWNWTDNVAINPNACTDTSATSSSGAQTLTATCQDPAGNVGTASVQVKVDLTRPSVSVTGVRSGAVYAKGKVPAAGCRTTEGVSGVATAAKVRVTTTGSNGVGKFTAACSGAVSVAGTSQAAAVQVTYTVGYGFSGWTTPKPGSTIAKSSGRITAEFRLAGTASGTPIVAAVASKLGAAHDVEVTLRGPDIKVHTALCSWVASARVFRCTIAMPPGAEKGSAHSYTLTVTENVGTGFKTAPVTGRAQNPAVIHFR